MASKSTFEIKLSDFVDLSSLLNYIDKYFVDNPESFIKIIYNNSSIWVEILEYIFQKRTLPFFEVRIVPYEWDKLQNIIKLMNDIQRMTPVSIEQIRTQYQRDYGIIPKFAFPPMASDHVAREVLFGLTRMKEATWIPLDVAVTQKPDYGRLSKYLTIPTYSSGRPKTSMPFLGELKNVVLETDMLVVDYGIFQYGSDFYTPILRYAEGMSRGGYYEAEPQPKLYCGTFYYIDLDEDRYLRLGNFRIFRNKFAAYVGMKQSISEEDLHRLIDAKTMEELVSFEDPTDESRQSSLFANAIVKVADDPDNEPDWDELPEEMIALQRQLFYEYMVEGKEIVNKNGKIWYDPDTNTSWTGKYSRWLYADEDRFDQTICILAKHLGVDCVILTNMVGGNRIVSELLDTRDRAVSYSSIVRFTR